MSEPFIAEIIMFGGNFAPRAWSFCNGALLPIASNTALFSLIGTTYGGDGRTTTQLPDLRGRTAIHQGRGPGLTSYRLGQKGGTETNMLQLLNLANHTHTTSTTVAAFDGDGDSSSPVGNYLSNTTGSRNYSAEAPGDTMANGSVTATVANSTGGGTAVNNLQPFLGINYLICLQGLYPSRS